MSTFFGYNNERLMSPAFIVFYALLATIIRDRVAQSSPMILTLIIAAILSCFHHTYARFPLPRGVTIMLSLVAFGIVTFSSVYYRQRLPRLTKF